MKRPYSMWPTQASTKGTYLKTLQPEKMTAILHTVSLLQTVWMTSHECELFSVSYLALVSSKAYQCKSNRAHICSSHIVHYTFAKTFEWCSNQKPCKWYAVLDITKATDICVYSIQHSLSRNIQGIIVIKVNHKSPIHPQKIYNWIILHSYLYIYLSKVIRILLIRTVKIKWKKITLNQYEYNTPFLNMEHLCFMLNIMLVPLF